MRFSLRWLLSAFVFVALSAAAVVTISRALAGLIWAIAGLAFGYAVVLSIISSGRRQASAIGFVVISSLYALALLVVPEWASTLRAFEAAGYALDAGWALAPDGYLYTRPGNKYLADFQPAIAAGNAAVTMAAGLIGYALGARAFQGEARAS